MAIPRAALTLALTIAPACASSPTPPPPQTSSPASPAQPTSAPPAPATTQPAATPQQPEGDAPAAWWTPVPPISRESLTEADKAAVKDCVQQHRVAQPDATADELYAGATCLGGHRAFAQEIKVFTHLLRQHPDAAQAPEVLILLGHRYEQLDVRTKAVDTYEQLLALYPKRNEARTLGKRAVCLARSLGDTAKVEDLLRSLERLYGRKGFVMPPDVALEQLCVALPPVRG